MRPGKGHRNPSKRPPVTDRRIVPVDDGPLRTHAARECNRAMAKLEKARAELRRFEQEDGPAFGRWMAATFGAFLTEIRENAQKVAEQENLIEEVEMEMAWSGHYNPRKAYAAVLKSRENPDQDFDKMNDMGSEDGHPGNGPEDAAGPDPFEEMGTEIPEEDRRALFDDFVRGVLGIDPEEMGEAEYAEAYTNFEEEMFGKDPQARPFQGHREEKRAVGGEEARIKEIYRLLVRRLHPDLRADGDPTVSAIWHEVQAAYEERNLDRLETLLALTEMESGTDGTRSSLSQMRLALVELNRAFRAIQRSLGAARRDPAWGFSRDPYHGPLEKRVRRELEESLYEQRRVLAELKQTLDEWSRPRPASKKRNKHSGPLKNSKAGRGQPSRPKPFQTEFFSF